MKPGEVYRTRWKSRCGSCGKDIPAHTLAKWIGQRLGNQCYECAGQAVTVRKVGSPESVGPNVDSPDNTR